MPQLTDIVAYLENLAPPDLAEDWDNVGLLVGDGQQPVERVMTCLTLTPDVAEEAVWRKTDLVVTHHPILFRPVQRLTSDTHDGKLLLELIAARVAVYSPHTAFDSTAGGINQSLAESLGLLDIDVLRPAKPGERGHGDTEPPAASTEHEIIGGGRCGSLPQPESLVAFNERVKAALDIRYLQYVGDEGRLIQRVGVACGSAAEFLPDARKHECDVFVTGEARFHACLEARATGIAMVLAGHYATERPAVERLAFQIGREFPDVTCVPSGVEEDPLRWSVS